MTKIIPSLCGILLLNELLKPDLTPEQQTQAATVPSS
jgi:hypothetical protein